MLRTALILLACTACRPDDDDSPGGDDSGTRPGDPWLDPAVPLLADDDPDPAVFEATITASQTDWSYAPDAESVHGLAYNGTVPGPLIRVGVGTRLIIHFVNDLGDGFETTIHWHGIEGNNAADGTHTTQLPVMPGERYDYTFTVTRPGQFWYHPHMRGAQGVFDGLYAPLIVDDDGENELRASGLVPSDERLLVLSDLSETNGAPWSVEVDNAMVVMNGIEGDHLLVNGKEDPVFEVRAGEPLRLRLFNSSITRFWRLSIPGHTLYRIGGQGGLLDAVRTEGGEALGRLRSLADDTDLGPDAVALGFDTGEIVLAPAERADVVLVPTGSVGDEIDVVWKDYARGRHGMWMEGDTMVMGDAEDDGTRPSEVVAKLRITSDGGEGWVAKDGSPLLSSIGRAVGAVDTTDAIEWTGASASVLSEDMAMWLDDEGVWQMSTDLYIDGASWQGDHMAGPDQPEAPTAVHAKLGDVLLWEVRNQSHMAHPFHLHGFSFQPVAYTRYHVEGDAEFETATTATTWDAGYDEFVDTIDIPGLTSVVLRVALLDPVGGGAASGRWMRHCHIMQHGENGMMSELVVEP